MKPSPRLHSLRLGAFLILLATSTAAGAEPTPAERETARAAFTEGDEAFDRGDFEAALRSYRAADAIMKAPPTAFATCEALTRLERLVEARNACVRAFQGPVVEGEPASYPESREQAQELAKALEARIPTVRVLLPTVPPDVELTLTVDGESMPAAVAAAPLRLDPGSHDVSVSAPGFDRWTTTITLKEAEERSVTVSLEPLPTVPGENPPPEAPPAVEEGSISPVAWIGFGIGAAGLIAGGITGGLALSASNDLESRCTAPVDGGCDRAGVDDPAGYQSDLDRATILAHVSTASFAVGGAGVVLGLVGLLALGDEGPESRAQLRLGPGSFTLSGSF